MPPSSPLKGPLWNWMKGEHNLIVFANLRPPKLLSGWRAQSPPCSQIDENGQRHYNEEASSRESQQTTKRKAKKGMEKGSNWK
jgi:hypothetical protein